MNFLRNFLASILGTLVAMILIVILFFIAAAGMATSVGLEEVEASVELRENSVLELEMDVPIYDNVAEIQSLEGALGLSPDTQELKTLLDGIKAAKTNDKIKGITLKSPYVFAGWAQTKAIRDALVDFKESGKFIYSYADFYTQKGYYMASVADSVFVHPMGGVEFKGLASEVMYFKDFQEKYGFKMEVIRHGKYKSAVEPYLENEMSDANRQQISALLESIWSNIRQDIAQSRNLTEARLDEIANDLLANLPQEAIAVNLADALIYEEDFKSKINTALEQEEENRIRNVSATQLAAIAEKELKGIRNRIAVIYAQGPVIYGEGSENTIGQDVFVDAIEEATKNKRVKAIVLRVDSPGGSALTSDILWNALEKAKAKKPVVVSMGNVAASGGYYIACNADEVFANPMTITGSIGVFATVPNLKGFTDDIGINAEQVITHKNAMGYSAFEEPSETFRATTKEGIEYVYNTFKDRVARGRSLSLEQVEAIAQGRVWSGNQAVENGLVDQLGDVNAAIAAAARLAEIEEFRIRTYPKIEPELEDFLGFGGPFGSLETQLLGGLPETLVQFLHQIQSKEKVQFQTQLPYALDIR